MARIVVTRPAGRERALVERLRDAGHEVDHVPLVALEPLGDDPVDVGGSDWVILTSVTGARELRRRMRGTPTRVAAIGNATAEAFGGADLVAATSTQEGLLEALPQDHLRLVVVVLYRTVELTPPAWSECDLVILASPSAARALGRVAAGTPVVSIGPETTRAAREAGLTVATEARTSDLDGLAEAVG